MSSGRMMTCPAPARSFIAFIQIAIYSIAVLTDGDEESHLWVLVHFARTTISLRLRLSPTCKLAFLILCLNLCLQNSNKK